MVLFSITNQPRKVVNAVPNGTAISTLRKVLHQEPITRQKISDMLGHLKHECDPGTLADYFAMQTSEIQSPLNHQGAAEEFHTAKPTRNQLSEHYIHVGAAQRAELTFYLLRFLIAQPEFNQAELSQMEESEINSSLNHLGTTNEFHCGRPTNDQLRLHYVATDGEVRLFIKYIFQLLKISEHSPSP